MITTDERVDCQMRDIKFIAEKIKEAKHSVKFGSVAWNALDLAEARLQGLSLFTSFGRGRLSEHG